VSSSNHSALSGFLERLLSRSALSNEEQQAILGLTSHAHQTRANWDIVSPGDTVDHACLVADGLAARFDQMADGRRQITAIYLRGDMCDLHSVVAPTAAWGIGALTTTTVLRVPHRELRQLAGTYPGIALAFWRDVTTDASVLSKWVGNVGRRDARARIAHLLCETGIRMEWARLGTRTCFPFEMTQQQLSDATGMTAVHVNRTIQALRAAGIIRTEGRTMHVDDWPCLTQVADFDPAYLLLDGQSGRVAA
jgi:CRP-like cAMP-binding protein